MLNTHIQRKAARSAEDRAFVEKLDAERRQREGSASAQARDALSKLLLLKRDPDYDRRVAEYRLERRRSLSEADYVRELERIGEPDEVAMAAWQEERDALVMAVDTAAVDLSDQDLRTRLNEVCDMLRFYDGPERHAHQMEHRTRYLAARYGFECLGGFRRGDSLPERSQDYRQTLGFVQIYLDEMEMNTRPRNG